MPGSAIGKLFRVTTFGESHGNAIGCIVEGVPPNIPLSEADIQTDLDRRRPGQSEVATPRKESDTVELLSGVFEGRTVGPPIAMLIRNKNYDPSAYVAFRHKFRPGHADYSYLAKYGLRDWRGSGRASGRETACRVAAGAVAKKVLAEYGVTVTGYAREIAGIRAEKTDLDRIEENMVRTCDPDKVDEMVACIRSAREQEDSVGGQVEVLVQNLPVGLGDPVFDKLEARLAHAVMSIGAVKGFEMGVGFAGTRMKGSAFNDPFTVESGRVRTASNHSGGILGGISTGEDVLLRAAVRPPASIARTQQTVNVYQESENIEVHGRHDPCIVPRAVPVVEAMVAIVLADALLIQHGYSKYREDMRSHAQLAAESELGELQQAASQQPEDPEIHARIGEALALLGRESEAADAFRRSLALDADNAAVHNALGELLDRGGEREKAGEAFAAAVAVDPDFTPATYNLANLQSRLGDPEAVARLRDAKRGSAI